MNNFAGSLQQLPIRIENPRSILKRRVGGAQDPNSAETEPISMKRARFDSVEMKKTLFQYKSTICLTSNSGSSRERYEKPKMRPSVSYTALNFPISSDFNRKIQEYIAKTPNVISRAYHKHARGLNARILKDQNKEMLPRETERIYRVKSIERRGGFGGGTSMELIQYEV